MYPMEYKTIFNDDGTIREEARDLFPTILPSGQPSTDATQHTAKLAFLNPRDNQSVIAPGRDFYVTGIIQSPSIIPDNATLDVYLFNSSGRSVRHVFCKYKDDKEHLFVENRNWITTLEHPVGSQVTKADQEKARYSCIPDLVYDHLDNKKYGPDEYPESIKSVWNKAYYTDTFFSALIHGGEFGDDAAYIKENDLPVTIPKESSFLVPLKEGNYKLLVSLSYNGTILGDVEKTITIGHLKNKVLGAFTDGDCKARMMEFDGINNGEKWTVLIDPFPGGWAKAMIAADGYPLRLVDDKDTEAKKNSVGPFWFITNWRRVCFNDSCEYRGGNIYFLDFATRDKSIALRIELAEVFKQINLKNDHISLIPLYYDGGQPYSKGLLPITPGDSDEEKYGRKSNLVGWAPGQMIAFTSVDTSTDLSRAPLIENDGYNLESASKLERTLYAHHVNNVGGAKIIQVPQNAVVRVNGVCMLPMDQSPSERDDNGGYTDLNLITEITYEILDKDYSKVRDITKPVGLKEQDKVKKGKWEEAATRVLEFKHLFDLSPYIRPSYYRFHIKPVSYRTRKGKTISITRNDMIDLTVMYRQTED